MSIAEQLKQEGRQEGVPVGGIQTLQRVLGKPVTPVNTLLKRSVDQLRRQHALMQRQLR